MPDHSQVKDYLAKKMPAKKLKLDDPFASAFKIAEPATPPPPPVEFTVVNDSSHPDVGNVVVDEHKKITFYLHDDWSIREFRGDNITKLLEKGETKFPAHKVVLFNFDPVNQRTCVFFSPGQDDITAFGAELSAEYDFDRPHELNQCAKKEIAKLAKSPTPSCIENQKMAQCHYYQPEPWKKVREVKAATPEGDVVKLSLQYTRKGNGFPNYRISKLTNENEIAVILDTLTSIEHNKEIHTVAKDFFEARIADLNATEEVVELPIPEEEQAPVKKYFDYVLA